MKIDALVATEQYKQQAKESQVQSSDFDKLLEQAKATGDKTELRKATDELESVFINMMLKAMRTSLPENEGIFKKSESEKMFQEMLDTEYAKEMADSGGIGISDMIYNQLESYMDSDEEAQVSTFELKG